MKTFTEAVGLRRADFGAAMLDLADSQEQLEVVLELAPAIRSAVIGKNVLDLDRMLLLERQHP